MGNSAPTPGTGPRPATTRPVTERPAPPGTRARQRADTRERLFESALREFAAEGFAAAQIDRIARTAGVARGTFYFHFPTKDDVLLELAQRINARVVRRLTELEASQPSLEALLVQLGEAVVEEHARVTEAGLTADVLSIYTRRPDDLRDRLHATNAPTVTDVLAAALRRLAQEGRLDEAPPAEELAAIVTSSLIGVLARVAPGEPVRRARDLLIGILVRGIGRPG